MNETPMMRQYAAVKAQHPHALLFYRMGDFFELFGDDALCAADVLGVALTRRRTAKEGDEGTPMCGVPAHAVDSYIAKALNAGFKVALCDQTETPEQAKARGGSGALISRDVVRLYTGGTLTEDTLLTSTTNSFLLFIAVDEKNKCGLCWVDISTGDVLVGSCMHDELPSHVSRIMPSEIVAAENVLSTLTHPCKTIFIPQGDDNVLGTLCPPTLPPLQRVALNGAVSYIRSTQMGKLPPLRAPTIIAPHAGLALDAHTRTHLELLAPLRADEKTEKSKKPTTLFAAIDHTKTAAGARLLKQWVLNPLTDLPAIHARQTHIQLLTTERDLRRELQTRLGTLPDVERALTRLGLGRGSPRDVAAIRTTLLHLPALAKLLQPFTVFEVFHKTMQRFEKLATHLHAVLADDNLPLLAREGGFVKNGFCDKLDAFRTLARDGLSLLQALEKRESDRTGISSLKIKYNKVWGYFIEITNTHKDKVPNDFIHRQTTSTGARFSTTALMELERNLSAAEANALNREQEIFAELVSAITARSTDILHTAHKLAELDVLQCASELITRARYVLPVVDGSAIFSITQGRHAVVEHATTNFIANDTELSNHTFVLLTGPNMAGKSTYLRQVALVVVLAQMGFPVPAQSAHIGIVDKLFTRIGAADNLTAGHSTFMVEMLETANILTQATEKSLVLLDEIGRGTATYDGLAIAWATTEHLATEKKCRGIFATHYHELTVLAEQISTLKNLHVAVKEWQGDIVFLHQVKPGAASGSFGVHVARLAGMPTNVVARATDILMGLEKSSAGKAAASGRDLPLFTAPVAAPSKNSVVEEKVLAAPLDELSPREAHALLYDLKKLAEGAKA